MQKSIPESDHRGQQNAPVVSGRSARKFITDLFTGKEHQSFTSREELIRAITANGFAPDTVHEVEAPAICNDVTDDIAWGVVEFRRADGDDLTDLERDFVEQTIGIEAARSSMEAA